MVKSEARIDVNLQEVSSCGLWPPNPRFGWAGPPAWYSQKNKNLVVNPDGEGFSATSCLTQTLAAKGLNGPEGNGNIANSSGKTVFLKKAVQNPCKTRSVTLEEFLAAWPTLSENQKQAIMRIARG